MSMIGNLQRATDADVARLLANPEEIRRFLYGETDRYDNRADTRLHKAWHGIHFVLTGSAWGGEPPLNFLVSGGASIGDEGSILVDAYTGTLVKACPTVCGS